MQDVNPPLITYLFIFDVMKYTYMLILTTSFDSYQFVAGYDAFGRIFLVTARQRIVTQRMISNWKQESDASKSTYTLQYLQQQNMQILSIRSYMELQRNYVDLQTHYLVAKTFFFFPFGLYKMVEIHCTMPITYG